VHPKFFYFDCGVFRTLRPTGPLDKPAEIDGAALETLVYQHLLAWINNGNQDVGLSFWRTQNGVEVDFVMYGKDTFAAIEVKNTARVRTEDLKGLRAFKTEFPQAIPILLYRGDLDMTVESIHIVPVTRFLRGLNPLLPVGTALNGPAQS
jgi:uncharacterized protein